MFYTAVVTTTQSLFNLSSTDGRYSSKTAPLAKIFSEAALISNRITIEVEYLLLLSKYKIVRKLSPKEQKLLRSFCLLDTKQLLRVKTIEQETHHDVKAVEYFLREKISNTSLVDLSSFIHFGVTSEDINNLAYRLMIKKALKEVIIPELISTLINLNQLAETYKDQPMLARTHGQAAIPTTFGKEIAVFISRINPLIKKVNYHQLVGKFNGAVGGYQALALAYPNKDWLKITQELVESFGLKHLALSTQINPQDDLINLFQTLQHLNLILIGLNQDIWHYISDDWLVQLGKKNRVGSSTMPQKVNPIEFENSEGNLKLANGFIEVFINNFPISRLQRDLSDSTIQRNIGTCFAHCLLGYQSISEGLKKIKVNKKKVEADLLSNWNILSEALQTIARKNGDKLAYEKVAKLSKQKKFGKNEWLQLVKEVDPSLELITPLNYLGLSTLLTEKVVIQTHQLIKEIQQ